MSRGVLLSTAGTKAVAVSGGASLGIPSDTVGASSAEGVQPVAGRGNHGHGRGAADQVVATSVPVCIRGTSAVQRLLHFVYSDRQQAPRHDHDDTLVPIPAMVNALARLKSVRWPAPEQVEQFGEQLRFNWTYWNTLAGSLLATGGQSTGPVRPEDPRL